MYEGVLLYSRLEGLISPLLLELKKTVCQIVDMPFFFDLVYPIFGKPFPEGDHRVLNEGGVADPIPIVVGAAAPHVVDLLQLSM